MAGGRSTINTILETSADGSTWTKLCKIKSYPALGGSPEQLETTDLEDETQTYVPGVQSMEAMEFTANYELEAYLAVKTKANTDLHYRVSMGKEGVDGVATWQGQHSVYINEGEVNGVREMTISVSPSTKIDVAAPAGSGS
ncbi:phage tail protein [Lactonifactor longoviformis]|nr:phage tail tube protein [Lactonifactor longoviformis]POP31851.1 phage tail protein [Lactonifactor longoviformis]